RERARARGRRPNRRCPCVSPSRARPAELAGRSARSLPRKIARMDASAAAERVKARARAAGFDLAGVARLGPATTHPAYLRWLERGDQGPMAWIERHADLRADPRSLLPGARSALVVALRYAPLGEADGPLWPRV